MSMVMHGMSLDSRVLPLRSRVPVLSVLLFVRFLLCFNANSTYMSFYDRIDIPRSGII